MSESYTPKQLEILRFIVGYRKQHGCAPTLEEIGNSLGVHRVTIHQHINGLVERGAVERDPKVKRRNLVVLDDDILAEEAAEIDKTYSLLESHMDHSVQILRNERKDETEPHQISLFCATCNTAVLICDKE